MSAGVNHCHLAALQPAVAAAAAKHGVAYAISPSLVDALSHVVMHFQVKMRISVFIVGTKQTFRGYLPCLPSQALSAKPANPDSSGVFPTDGRGRKA